METANSSDNRVLVFDWGNTLMKVFPQYSGPMAEWPKVEEVDGVVESLDRLLGHYTMAVATNASDSQSSQVWEALKRVEMGEYFKAVFTSRELGSRKPESAFFHQLESVLARPPYQMVMIGDDYEVDVIGAKAAGWKAVWYNPGHQLAYAMLPLHDAEIDDMRKLPAALQRLTLPDYPTCLAWLVERGIPYNILSHIQLVAAIAYQLAAWLTAAGEPVDPVLTQRGAMLHDLAKIDSIRRNKERGDLGDHAAMARDLLLARGQPELSEIADRHMPYQHANHPRRPLTWEQKLVHYADKLAEGSHLVRLEERLEALKQRYPSAAAELEASLPVLLGMQQEICERLGIEPQTLHERIRHGFGYR